MTEKCMWLLSHVIFSRAAICPKTTTECTLTKMMELVDMLGLGSSSLLSRGSSPLFGKIFFSILWLQLINFAKSEKVEERKKN
jgi:hypothetical protein